MGTTYSNLLDAVNATPRELLPAGVAGGNLGVYAGTKALATTDIDANDIVMLARVPSNERVLQILIYNDDLDSGGSASLAAHCGIYGLDEVVVDADVYAASITTLRSANTAGVNLAFVTRDINKMGQPVWKDAGLTEDSFTEYLIALTISAAAETAAAGDLSFIIITSRD